MPTELGTEFLGLLLDEELLREEFDEIVGAGWGCPQDRPAPRRAAGWPAPMAERPSPGDRVAVIDTRARTAHRSTGVSVRNLVVGERGPPHRADLPIPKRPDRLRGDRYRRRIR